MYAIVEIAGKQFKVAQGQRLYTPHLGLKVGSAIVFDRVLMTESSSNLAIGAPTITGAKVMGKVLDNVRGDKIIVFKKKRRKGYKKTQGHRQDYTKVLVEQIIT